MQRYKTFESNSQLVQITPFFIKVVIECKDTKLLKAIHNAVINAEKTTKVVIECKDTKLLKAIHNSKKTAVSIKTVVIECKDTKLLKAIHNFFP